MKIREIIRKITKFYELSLLSFMEIVYLLILVGCISGTYTYSLYLFVFFVLILSLNTIKVMELIKENLAQKDK